MLPAISQKLTYTVFNTAAGWVGLTGSHLGLRRVTLPVETREAAVGQLGIGITDAKFRQDGSHSIIQRLTEYFNGEAVDFTDVTIDFSCCTDFQRKVWQAVREIPYGETRSYGWVAARINRSHAARAVGQAVGRNSVLIIVPCHRVIAGDGSIGGFGGGLEMKKYLLRLEGTNPGEK